MLRLVESRGVLIGGQPRVGMVRGEAESAWSSFQGHGADA